MAPEGVAGYPRWDGHLKQGPAFPVIAMQEARRATQNLWSQVALTMVGAYALMSVAQLFTLSESEGAFVHTTDNYVRFLDLLRWGALAVAAVMAGPSLLEDARRGALELYLSRAVTRTQYLLGKVLAVVGVTTLALLAPALVYYGATFMIFETHPDAWKWAWAGAVAYSLMWGLLVSGVGMGLSCVARSSRAASLLLFGGFTLLDVFIRNLLENITRSPYAQLLSPFSAVGQQVEWLFRIPAPFEFPYWTGLVEWGALTLIGWGLVAWRHPRIRGEERAGR